MTLIYIILATTTVGLISFVGILFLYNKNHQKFLPMVIALAAGALLGAVFFGILPELFGHELEGSIFSAADISLIILLAILSFFIIEKYFHWHHCHCDKPHHHKQKKPIGYINLIGDGLHNFVDGMLIASAFLINPSLGVVTAMVIALHEIPQEIADYGVLLYAGFSRRRALGWNFLTALTAVAGGILAYLLGSTLAVLIPVFLSIATGAFLYLAMADIIPELHHSDQEKQIAWQTVWLLFGVGIIYFFTWLFPHFH